MSSETTPAGIAPTEDGTKLRIEWDDGHVSDYPPRYLRINCRCAGCRDEMTGEPLLDARAVPRGVHPLKIRYVGRYALRFDWSDGHDTGIYSFDLLRSICPCGECADR